ncbi:MAG TPA: SH3 domain-containing protein [Burkholderiaceae bacterium]|nr:SH3 domain-containing protein [Burkholderiaceae bacterium]
MNHAAARNPWQRALARAAACAVLVVSVAGATVSAAAAAEKVQVTDPYMELRTGPGRGYPVFFVAGREEWIEIVLRHTDWFKVRTANGAEGWVHRAQLETTLTEAGATKAFRDVLLDDYLQRKLELGGAWGQFKGEPMLKVWSAYRFADALSVEGTVGQVQGAFSGTEYWHINVNVEPWSDRRLSPFFGIGLGKFKNIPNASLVGAYITKANLANAAVGLRYHIAERFVARLDYSIYTAFVSDIDSAEYKAVTAGIAFFF